MVGLIPHCIPSKDTNYNSSSIKGVDEMNIIPTLFDSALTYLSMGFCVFPCYPNTKKPMVEWKEFQDNVPTIEIIEQWWSKCRDANVAVVTGCFSDVIVLDVDDPKAKKLVTSMGIIRNTPRVQTRPNRYHYYFKYPEFEARSKNNRTIGLDIRGDGGYVIAPPSIHPSGYQYRWIDDPFFGLPNCPSKMLQYLKSLMNEKQRIRKRRKNSYRTVLKRNPRLWKDIQSIVTKHRKIEKWLNTPKPEDRSGHDWGLMMLCLEHGIAKGDWLCQILLHNKYGKANSRKDQIKYISDLIKDVKRRIK